MLKDIEIIFSDGVVKTYPSGVSYYDISKDRRHLYEGDILVAKVNNDIVELNNVPEGTTRVEFLDLSSKEGNKIYAKGLLYVFVLAVKRTLGEDIHFRVENSIDKGTYIEFENALVNEELIQKLEDEMHNISLEKLPFKKVSVPRDEAIDYFKNSHRKDKVNNLKYISNSFINLYKLDNLYDYFYSEMPYTTKAINRFKLNYISLKGIVLSYPTIYNPTEVKPYIHHEKLFASFADYNNSCKVVEISNASDINKAISQGGIGDLIRISESLAEETLMNISDQIASRKGKVKIILMGGPTSSGKTTSSKKLAMFLRSKGFKPHAISIDDYFVDRHLTPVDAQGNPDYESLRAVDIELFNLQLNQLLDGFGVELPHYNFITGKKEFSNTKFNLESNGILIIEGLHALNTELTMTIPDEFKFKIYISSLTQLNLDNYNHVHTTDVRLLRRMIRDNTFRGHSPSHTLKLWKEVRAGEERYVFPFQDTADVIYNTALIYEVCVLKTYVEPLLFSVERDDENYLEALRLINFLRNFLPAPSDEVPASSLLREFIGGSCFTKK